MVIAALILIKKTYFRWRFYHSRISHIVFKSRTACETFPGFQPQNRLPVEHSEGNILTECAGVVFNRRIMFMIWFLILIGFICPLSEKGVKTKLMCIAERKYSSFKNIRSTLYPHIKNSFVCKHRLPQ